MSEYTEKFKLRIVKYCVEENHSKYDVAKEFNILSPTPIME